MFERKFISNFSLLFVSPRRKGRNFLSRGEENLEFWKMYECLNSSLFGTEGLCCEQREV